MTKLSTTISNMKKIQPILPPRPITKHQHEFQEVCEELEPVYGKAVWLLPHIAGVTEWKIREAAKIAKTRGNRTFPYLRGIIKRLP